MEASNKLVAVLVCRNNGTRLYGKPLQLIDIQDNLRIIDLIISNLKKIHLISEIVLGIADGVENLIYKDIAKSNNLRYVVGSESLVSDRYALAAKYSQADHVFRVTTECPFVWSEGIDNAYYEHLRHSYDATFVWNIIDGTEFEIYSKDTIEIINKEASAVEKEHLSMYVRNNPAKFNVNRLLPPNDLIREDIRLTVDNPEDLILCRKLYRILKERNQSLSIVNIVAILDQNPEMLEIVKPFLASGHKTMRFWGETDKIMNASS
jgi:spore coat polysaccharide biosynthesis protein SpsF